LHDHVAGFQSGAGGGAASLAFHDPQPCCIGHAVTVGEDQAVGGEQESRTAAGGLFFALRRAAVGESSETSGD